MLPLINHIVPISIFDKCTHNYVTADSTIESVNSTGRDSADMQLQYRKKKSKW